MQKFFDKILRWLSHFFSLDLPYFFKNHFFLSMATATDLATGFVLSILFSHFVNKTTYGQYVLIFSFISTLSVTKLTGLQSIFPFAITMKKEGFYPQVQKISFLSSLVGSAGLIAIAIYYAQPDKPPLMMPILLAAVVFPVINGLVYYSSFLPAKKMFKLFSLYSILQSTIPNLAIALAILFSGKIVFLMAAALLPQAILNIYFTYKTLQKVKNPETSRKDLLYGLKLSAIYFLPTLAAQFDSLILAKFLGFEKLAIYSFATVIPKRIAQFTKNFETLSLPKIGNLSPHALTRDLPKIILQFTFLTAVMSVGYIVFAPYVFNFFYPQYHESIFPSQVYSLIWIFYPLILVTQTFHRLRTLPNTTFFSIFSLVVKTLLLFLLIPRFGILGAVSALILTELLKYILAFVLLFRIKVSALTEV